MTRGGSHDFGRGCRPFALQLRTRKDNVMSITFSVADDVIASLKSASIRPRQLAAFRVFARAEAKRSGITVIDPAGQGFGAYDFEARVCPFALATIAALFDMDADVIGVLEEAQFRGRLVRFERDKSDGMLRIRVSAWPDGALEMNISNANAYAILEALGLETDAIGEISSAELRAKLTDPDIRKRFEADHLEHYIAPLTSLAWTGDEDANARVVWA